MPLDPYGHDWTRDTSIGASNVSVKCLRCGHMARLNRVVIDREGPAFAAYYHEACAAALLVEEAERRERSNANR